MREILFRGKQTDNDESEFVYGIPVEGEPLLGMGKRTYIITKPGVQWVDGVYMTYDECIEVDPETVSQFIGLTDKNGVKIFEGDIVRHGQCGAVEYNSGSAQFALNFTDSIYEGFNNIPFIPFCDCEVLGNIYDNPVWR